MVNPGADGGELPGWRRGLAILILAPALDGAVRPQHARGRSPGTDGGELPGRRLGCVGGSRFLRGRRCRGRRVRSRPCRRSRLRLRTRRGCGRRRRVVSAGGRQEDCKKHQDDCEQASDDSFVHDRAPLWRGCWLLCTSHRKPSVGLKGAQRPHPYQAHASQGLDLCRVRRYIHIIRSMCKVRSSGC